MEGKKEAAGKNKKPFVGLVALLMFGSVLALLPAMAVGDANNESVLTVDSGGSGDYTNIQDAVDAAPPGSTIYVLPGIYEGGIVVEKPINLIGVVGEEGDMPQILLDGTSGTVIYVNGGGNCSLENFLIAGGEIAIEAYNTNTTVRGIKITDSLFGMSFVNADKVVVMDSKGIDLTDGFIELNKVNTGTVSDVLFYTPGTKEYSESVGVFMFKTGSVSIENAEFTGVYEGVEIRYGVSTYVYNMTVSNSDVGLIYSFGDGSVFIKNSDLNDTSYGIIARDYAYIEYEGYIYFKTDVDSTATLDEVHPLMCDTLEDTSVGINLTKSGAQIKDVFVDGYDDYSFNESTGVLTVFPPPDWSGQLVFDVKVVYYSLSEFSDSTVKISTRGKTGDDAFPSITDEGTGTSETEHMRVYLDVTPVNDPPRVSLPDRIVFYEDGGYILNLSGKYYDVEGDGVTYEVVPGDNLTVSVSGDTVFISAAANWSDQSYIRFIFTDSQGSQTVWDIAVYVIPQPDLLIEEDTTGAIVLDDYFAQGFSNIYWENGEHTVATWDPINNTLVVTPEHNWYGIDRICITTEYTIIVPLPMSQYPTLYSPIDPELPLKKQPLPTKRVYTDTRLAMIYVTPVNDPPVTVNNASIQFNEDTTGMLDVSTLFKDIDSQLTYTVENSGVFSTRLDGSVLYITPPLNWNGESDITVAASDGEYSTTAVIHVSVAPVNDPPVAPGTRDIYLSEDTSETLALASLFEDVDGDTLTYAIEETDGVQASLNSGTLLISPPADWSGDGFVVVSATDGEYTATTTFNIHVSPVDDPPALVKKPAAVTMSPGSTATVLLTDYFYDKDSELTFYAESGDLTVEIDSGMLYITAPSDFSGTTTVHVVATDGLSSADAYIPVYVAPETISAGTGTTGGTDDTGGTGGGETELPQTASSNSFMVAALVISVAALVAVTLVVVWKVLGTDRRKVKQAYMSMSLAPAE